MDSRNMYFVYFLLSFALQALSQYYYIENQCQISKEEKVECGYPGVTREACTKIDCCYEPVDGADASTTPWCYQSVTRFVIKPTGFSGYSTLATKTIPTVSTAAYITLQTTNATTSSPITTPTSAAKSEKLSLLTLVQMKLDNVSQSVINSLMADALPNGQLLYALQDGKLDDKELVKLSAGQLTLNPLIARYMYQNNAQGLLYGQLAKLYGVPTIVIKLLMSKDKSPVIKHLASRLSADGQLNPLSSFVISAITSGGITQQKIKDFLIDQTLQKENFYSRQAFKSMIKGDKLTALKWSYLGAYQKSLPVSVNYPKNGVLFAYLVDTQKTNPNKIPPSVIFSLALNASSVPALGTQGKAFLQLFGVKAFDYVCASHSSKYRKPCSALRNRIYPSTLDCVNAGCCVYAESQNEPSCFENVFGKIGVGLAQNIWNNDYIVKKVFGGTLPDLKSFYPQGIPWLQKERLLSKFRYFNKKDPNQPSWFDTLKYQGIVLKPRPTLIPTAPSKFRPNFVWRTHGPTTFPFPTRLPGNIIPLATQLPGVIKGVSVSPPKPSKPLVQGLTVSQFQSCGTIQKKDRESCMSNMQALHKNGEAKCKSLQCCYSPDWDDLTIPICFRRSSYGHCHKVDRKKRRNCGYPGISSQECLKDDRCCYDSSSSYSDLNNPVPWCFFKPEAILSREEDCKNVAYNLRQPCYKDERVNQLVNEETCKSVPHCCYDDVKISYVAQYLGKKVPPSCYKNIRPPVLTTTAAPVTPPKPPAKTPIKTCKPPNALHPLLRKDCGKYYYPTCVLEKGCCYLPDFKYGGPWCYYKT